MKCKSLLLVVLITLYLLIGACLFPLLENEPQMPSALLPGPVMKHGNLLQQIQQISEEFPDANKTLLMAALGIPPPQVVAEALTGGAPSNNNNTYTVQPSGGEDHEPEMVQLPYAIRMVYWFTYCVSLLTTVGYGDVCPQTAAGKAFTLLYGSIGIPFIFLCLFKLGLMFRQSTRGLLSRVADRWGALESLFKRHGYFPVELPLQVVLYVCLIVLVPSAVFQSVEKWSFGDSVYYCFISLSTVGFGDFVHNQAHLGFPLRKVLIYKIITKVWMFSGLVWQACILSILWHQLTRIPAFRRFMRPGRSAKYIVEDIAMGNGHMTSHRGEEEEINQEKEDEENAVAEEEKLNTSREPEKEKLKAEC